MKRLSSTVRPSVRPHMKLACTDLRNTHVSLYTLFIRRLLGSVRYRTATNFVPTCNEAGHVVRRHVTDADTIE